MKSNPLQDSARRPPRRPPASGFTLIEVLLVLVILVVLGAIAASNFSGAQNRAEINAAKSQVGLLASNIDRFRFDCKKYPEALEDLIQKPSDDLLSKRWDGPYLNKSKIPLDPWDNAYKYSAAGKKNAGSFDVWSTGPDGQDGSDDDIGNWAE
ncbi:MAG: type II secretion system major pseudopilin GspG [Planctomycetota bacterium]